MHHPRSFKENLSDITALFTRVLTTIYLSDNQVYQQLGGVALGNSVSHVIADDHKEAFEKIALRFSCKDTNPLVLLRE